MTKVEQVDAAMIEHLTREVARLETENADLRKLLERPIHVAAPPPPPLVPNYTDQQMVSALQGINGAIYNISTTLNDLKTQLTQP